MKRFIIPAFLCAFTFGISPLPAQSPADTSSTTADGPNITNPPPPPPKPDCKTCSGDKVDAEDDGQGNYVCPPGSTDASNNNLDLQINVGLTTYATGNNILEQDLALREKVSVSCQLPMVDTPPFQSSLSAEWGKQYKRPVTCVLRIADPAAVTIKPNSFEIYGMSTKVAGATAAGPYTEAKACGTSYIKRNPTTDRFQTYTDQFLVDFSYTASGTLVRYYLKSVVGAKDTSGFYPITASQPIKTLLISQPSPGIVDVLQHEYFSSSTAPKVRGYRWNVTAASSIMTTHIGNPADTMIISRNTLVKSSLGNGLSQQIRTLEQAASSPQEIPQTPTAPTDPTYGLFVTSKTLEQFRDLGNETLRIVKRIDAYDTSEAVTTDYTYTDATGTGIVGAAGVITAPKAGTSINNLIGARLHTLQRSDGYWEQCHYQYNGGTQIMLTEKWSSWKNSAFGDKANAHFTSIVLEKNSRTVIEKIAGQLVSNLKETLSTAANGTRTLRTEQKSGTTSAPLITEHAYHADSLAEPLKGRIQYTRRPDGTLTRYTYATVSGNLKTTTEHGSAGPDQFAASATGPVPALTAGTRTVSTTNSFQHPIETKSYDIASGLLLDQSIAASVDAVGRPTHIIYDADPADFETFVFSCCGIQEHRQRDGSLLVNQQDFTGRIKYSTVTLGSKITATGRSYTSASIGGRTLPKNSVTQSVTAGSESTGSRLVSESISNLRGQTLVFRSPDANNDDSPDETTYAYDPANRSQSSTGPDGITHISTTYADGQTHTSISTFASDPITPLTTYDYTPHNQNGGGIQSTVTQSGAGVSPAASHSFRDLAGRATRTESPGYNGTTLVSTTTFDERGRPIGQSSTGNPSTLRVLNLLGETTESWTDSNGDGQFNNAAVGGIKDSYSKSLSDFATEASTTCQRTRQWIRDDSDTDLLISTSFRATDGLYQKSIPLSGPITVTTATKSIKGSASSETKTYLTPTRFLRQSAAVTLNADGSITTVSTNQDTTGATLTSASQSTDLLGRTLSSTGERGLTTTYSQFTQAGKPLKTTQSDGTYSVITLDTATRPITQQTYQADNTLIATVHTSYHPNGQPAATWGTNTNPTFKLYDLLGRPVELRTYRSSDLTLSPTASTPDYDTTTWSYESATGLLLAKRDAADKGANYTYTPDGKLLTRTWARGVTTTYAYNPAGQLISTDYSDTTPDVSLTYDRLGRVISSSTLLTDHSALITSSTNTYNPTTLVLDAETITYNLPGQALFTRILDRSRDTLGRDSGWQLKNASTLENQTTYGYSPTTARLETIRSGDTPVPTNTFTYHYLPNSSILEKIAGPIHDVHNTYEPTRNILASKQNKVGTTVISQYDYTVNALGQRTNVSQVGTAFQAVRSIAWGYDTLGQVTSADSSVNTHDRAYQYDTIGNRLQSGEGVSPAAITNYTANALNQYSSITNPQSTILNPIHDADGNATAYPLPANSVLIWDAENRLISTTAGTNTKTTLYDSQSRRISDTAGSNTTLYVYDGFNCIAEYTGTTLSKTRLWGVDLSGSMQGAGGVGGILAEKQGSDLYQATYDGNGNVSEYLDSTGSIVAHYEYDPFGNTVVATGPKANDLAYRFSTKPLDQATRLYCYQYRWYDPATGRWPSRDPIEEEGGLNLYGFVGNDGVNLWDLLGLVQIYYDSNGKEVGRKNDFPHPNAKFIQGDRGCFKFCGKRYYMVWRHDEEYLPGESQGVVEDIEPKMSTQLALSKPLFNRWYGSLPFSYMFSLGEVMENSPQRKPWDFKRQLSRDKWYTIDCEAYRYDSIGNIVWGATMRSHGWPEDTALTGAGAIQLWDDFRNWKYNRLSTWDFINKKRSGYGDEARDSAAIKEGYRWDP